MFPTRRAWLNLFEVRTVVRIAVLVRLPEMKEVPERVARQRHLPSAHLGVTVPSDEGDTSP